MLRQYGTLLSIFLLPGTLAIAEDSLAEALGKTLVTSDVIAAAHRDFVLTRIKKLTLAPDATTWQREADVIRRRVLDEVVFRGVSVDWRHGSPTPQWSEVIETDHDYRIRKLRFQAVPGMWIPALLYEPKELVGKVPVVLNVNGHESTGKATDYKQLRCINLAKRGMLALNLEWVGMGQLKGPGYAHNHLAKLDLCGVSGLSVFYLAMARGLDVLLDHAHADAERVAVTGLSGGGWQTIVLSALDQRVRLAVPVAGHSALAQRVANTNSIGDLEQNPSDLASIADYVHLNALMTPRPLLLIYNTKDDCCFVARTVKSNTYDPVIRFYEQAGVRQRLAYYENSDPGTHNYEVDNRQQFYRFLNRHFLADGPRNDEEIPSRGELQTAETLQVAIPTDNADFDSLAAKAAVTLPRGERGSKAQQREQLRNILHAPRYETGADRFTGPNTVDGLEVRRFVLRFGEDWSLPGVVVQGARVDRSVLLLSDGGFASEVARIRELVASGARVVALDPLLVGVAKPPGSLYQESMLIATVGERALGIQASQILASSRFLSRVLVAGRLAIESHGPRCSLAARCAAALDDATSIDAVQTHDELASLKSLLRPDARYQGHPEAYCFGLLQSFDVAQLTELAGAQE
ncbi:MAG: acetylxylan esterase [Planctomycetota bacterium]|nr:acetylxylan esterase [Planctomycetota bacterium]